MLGVSPPVQRPQLFIDGTYDFSLDVAQVVDCGVKVGRVLIYALSMKTALLVRKAD